MHTARKDPLESQAKDREPSQGFCSEYMRPSARLPLAEGLRTIKCEVEMCKSEQNVELGVFVTKKAVDKAISALNAAT